VKVPDCTGVIWQKEQNPQIAQIPQIKKETDSFLNRRNLCNL